MKTAAPILLLAAALAAAPARPSPAPRAPDPVEAKFRDLQRELSGSGNFSATPGADAPAAEAPARGSAFGLGARVFSVLAFVLILAVACLRGLKRLQSRAAGGAGAPAGGFFEVLETCHLGGSHKVVALRARDDICLLGLGPQGVSLLHRLEGAAAGAEPRPASGNPAAFSESLGKLLERFQKPKKVSDYLAEG